MKSTKIVKTSAIVVGTALAGIVVGGVVLATPHTVKIVSQSDSKNFTATTKTVDTTMYKSMAKSLADQDSDVLPENVDGFTYTGCTDKHGKPFNINKRNPIIRGTTLYYNYRETLDPVAFIEDDKVSLVVNESISQPVDASQVTPAFAEDHPYEDFAGWTETTPDTVQGIISTDDETAKVYTAQWTGKTYSITYDYDGGYADGNPDTYVYGTGVDAFQNASKAGYTFDGWYDDAGSQVMSIAKDAHDDIHLTARYTAIPVARPSAPSANSSQSYSAPASNNDQGNGANAGGSCQPSGTAGSVSFDTGYSAGLEWGMTVANVDPWNIAALDSYQYEGFNFYGIADHDNQGGSQVEYASVMYVTIDGQSYTLHKLDTIYDDEWGHYGYPGKYPDRAAAEGAVVVYQTCTSTGVEYVLWG